jgi:hypothetical protein
MNDPPPGPTRVVRKSAYGRTQLFLPSKGVILREVKCMGGIVKHNQVYIYHVLPEVFKQANIACWHCCEMIKDKKQCVPIPRFYDNVAKLYHVFGATCSANCAKAYLIEHKTFDRAQSLNVLTKMLRDVYHINHPIIETPPRAALVRFGGIFNPNVLSKTHCTLVEPPFISYSMIAAERAPNAEFEIPTNPEVEEADTLDEPEPPALFEAFLQKEQKSQYKNENVETKEGQVKRRREVHMTQAGHTSTGSMPVGPMAKFVKK